MKKEKGFTLVELLAVIVIMAILLMVAIPAISKTLEDVRKRTFVNNVKFICTPNLLSPFFSPFLEKHGKNLLTNAEKYDIIYM